MALRLGLQQIAADEEALGHHRGRHILHRSLQALQIARPVAPGDHDDDDDDDDQEVSALIPGLPDSVALHCIARISRSAYPTLRCVSRGWNRVLSCATQDVFSVREEIKLTEAWIYFSFSSCPKSGTSNTNRFSNYFVAFDPGSNEWRNVGWIPGLESSEVLKSYGCIGLGGKLFIMGGKICRKMNMNQGREVDLFVRKEVLAYDCIGGRWKQCANMRSPRMDFACSVSGGRIYVSGGRNKLDHEALASAEVYIPELDEWRELPDMSFARYKCMGVTLKNKVYVIGGYTVETLHRSSVEIFDPSEKKWKLLPKMWALDIPPYEVVELHGRLYRSGDQLNHWRGSIDVYDEDLNLWKTIRGSKRHLGEDLSCGVRRYVTMTGIGKHLLFFGGHCRTSHHQEQLGDDDQTATYLCCFETVDAFKPAVGKWSTIDPFVISCCRELCSPCCVVFA